MFQTFHELVASLHAVIFTRNFGAKCAKSRVGSFRYVFEQSSRYVYRQSPEQAFRPNGKIFKVFIKLNPFSRFPTFSEQYSASRGVFGSYSGPEFTITSTKFI